MRTRIVLRIAYNCKSYTYGAFINFIFFSSNTQPIKLAVGHLEWDMSPSPYQKQGTGGNIYFNHTSVRPVHILFCKSGPSCYCAAFIPAYAKAWRFYFTAIPFLASWLVFECFYHYANVMLFATYLVKGNCYARRLSPPCSQTVAAMQAKLNYVPSVNVFQPVFV